MATVFTMTVLPSLRYIDIGNGCFGGWYDTNAGNHGGTTPFSLKGNNRITII